MRTGNLYIVHNIHGVAWTTLALFSTAAATGLLLLEPPIAIALIGGAFTAALTYFAPEMVLGVVMAASLFGGDMAIVASGGYFIAFASGAVASVLLPLQNSAGAQIRRMWIPATLLSLLAIRFAFQGDLDSVMVVARCLSVLVLVNFAVLRHRDVVRSLAIAGVAFGVCSALLGQYDPLDARWMGVSGNPNRMVFGLLIFTPFIVQYFQRWKPLLATTLISTVIAGTLVMLVASGSSQALAGVSISSIALLYMALQKTAPTLRHGIIGTSLVALISWLVTADHSAYLTDDIRTLSDRTSMFAAAWQDFLRNPAFGNGLRHVSDGAVVERSAHSSTLGLLASGGILVGALWLALLALMLLAGLRLLRNRQIIALAPIMLVTTQFVQSVELQVTTWAVVGLFLVRIPNSFHEGTKLKSDRARIGEL